MFLIYNNGLYRLQPKQFIQSKTVDSHCASRGIFFSNPSIMDMNHSATNLTLDALKSVVSQALLGKFTAVFPKLFKCQWKTYEGQKKVS